jgi:5-keto-L-gluconate epimerase
VRLAYTVSASPTRFAAVAAADVFEMVPSLARLGFDGVEIQIRDPAEVDIERLAAAVRQSAVTVPAVGTGQAYVDDGLCLTHAEAPVRARAVERLLAQVPVARRLGALLIVGLIHGPVPAGTTRRAAEEHLIDGLGAAARAARAAGVRVVVEPVNRYESNWLNTVEEVLDLVNRLGEENVGLLPDTFHMNIEERDVCAALRLAGPRAWHVHIADSNRRAPGWGHLDFAPVVETLRDIEYGGFFSAEVLPVPGVLDAARQTAAVMRPLLPRRDSSRAHPASGPGHGGRGANVSPPGGTSRPRPVGPARGKGRGRGA